MGVPNIVPDYEIARNTCREAPKRGVNTPAFIPTPTQAVVGRP